MPEKFPPELKEFIARHIASVEQLEVLLLLSQTPAKAWSAAELGRELRSNEASIAHWLNLLVSARLAEASEAGYRVQTGTLESEQLTKLLAATYRERPVPVIELIYSRPNPQLLDFSQAFKIRNRP